MVRRLSRGALNHRGAVTLALVTVLLFNLLVIGRVAPADPSHGDLPLASHCQGGGPGCAIQPMIPPPVGGLPQFDKPPAPAFGALVRVEPGAQPAVIEAPPTTVHRPPVGTASA